MKAEDLLLLAESRGIDLIAAARVASKQAKTNLQVTMRAGQRVAILLPPATNSARGKGSPSMLRPKWTVAELGIAAAGVSELEFQAATFAFAGSLSHYWRLHAALAEEADRMAKSQEWPMLIKDVFGLNKRYLEHMALLVLDEDQHPALFQAAPIMYSVYLGIPERTWDKHVAGRFSSLKFYWLRLIGSAASKIQARLSDGGFACSQSE